jgi:hypothetical protein
MLNRITAYGICMSMLLLAGCATPQKNYDYTAFKQSRPHSILVLPPQNNSPDVRATYSFFSTATLPLAESGYYVFPVALVDQTFRENGLVNPGEMHQAPLDKLKEIFGADAALYVTVTQYGSSYRVISSETRVTAKAKLVDLGTGKLLWEGEATASDSEGGNSNSGGLAGMLINALAKQIVAGISDQFTDHAHPIARTASIRLLNAHPSGLLYGPRSPMYEKD